MQNPACFIFFNRFILVAAILCIGQFFFSSQCTAAEHEISPRLSLRTTYDDNLFYDNEYSDFEFLASPEFAYAYRTSGSELDLSAKVDLYRYLQEDQYDRENQVYSLGLNRDISDYVSLSLEGRARIDHTFEDYLQETGVVIDKSKRYRYFLKPGVKVNLTPRSYMRLQPRARINDYAKDNTGNRDYRLYGLNWLYAREISLNSVLFLVADYQLLDPEDKSYSTVAVNGTELEYGQFDQEQHTLQLMTGLDHDWSRNLSSNFRVGGSYYQSEYELVTPVVLFGSPVGTTQKEIDEDKLGFVLDTDLEYEQEHYRATLHLSRNISQSSEGENITRDRARLRTVYDLSSYLESIFRLGYIRSKNDKDTSGQYADRIDNRSYAFSTGIRYELTRKQHLQGRYSYRGVERRDEDEYEKRNRFYLEYRCAFPSRY